MMVSIKLGTDTGGNDVVLETVDDHSMSTLVYGHVDSGKEKIMSRLVSGSFVEERRSWVIVSLGRGIVQPDGSVIIPGVDASRIKVIAPHPASLRRDTIAGGDIYTVPLHLCNAGDLFSLMKMENVHASATLDAVMDRLRSKHDVMSIGMLSDEIECLMNDDTFPNHLKWKCKMLLTKLKESRGVIINDARWSRAGTGLIDSMERDDPSITAIILEPVSASGQVEVCMARMIIREVLAVMQEKKRVPCKVGLLVDGMHHLSGSSRHDHDTVDDAMVNMMHGAGRDSRLWKIVTVTSSDRLPRAIRDDVDKDEGIFTSVINTLLLYKQGDVKLSRPAIIANRLARIDVIGKPFRAVFEVMEP
jgi:hypothetical protein